MRANQTALRDWQSSGRFATRRKRAWAASTVRSKRQSAISRRRLPALVPNSSSISSRSWPPTTRRPCALKSPTRWTSSQASARSSTNGWTSGCPGSFARRTKCSTWSRASPTGRRRSRRCPCRSRSGAPIHQRRSSTLRFMPRPPRRASRPLRGSRCRRRRSPLPNRSRRPARAHRRPHPRRRIPPRSLPRRRRRLRAARVRPPPARLPPVRMPRRLPRTLLRAALRLQTFRVLVPRRVRQDLRQAQWTPECRSSIRRIQQCPPSRRTSRKTS
mmetsp:Transcript_26238/g.75685  ORF Transcript_26238/g.75685 Transcript_26238/m.75685 type:complete len:273 (+) Transcript_26238:1490-2308(+)